MDTAELLRVPDVGRRLGVGPARAYQMVTEGLLPSVRYGRAVRIPRVAFERWLEAQSETALATVKPQTAA